MISDARRHIYCILFLTGVTLIENLTIEIFVNR